MIRIRHAVAVCIALALAGGELVSSITNWLHRDDLAAVVPDFITLAEAQFNRELRVPQMEFRAETNCTASDRYITLPDDFLELVSIRLEDTRYVPLEHVSVEYIDGALRFLGNRDA